MTDKIVMSANTALNNRVKVRGVTCFGAPSAIQGPNDAIKAKPILFSNLKEAEISKSELAVIACFDDPFLLEARETSQLLRLVLDGQLLQCALSILINLEL
jgi:Asp/Glu/hydantoin racemase